jgi:phosphoribosylanthranilate isomerase
VSSGVEIDRGVKNEQKIIEFIRIVRAFDEGVSNESRK